MNHLKEDIPAFKHDTFFKKRQSSLDRERKFLDLLKTQPNELLSKEGTQTDQTFYRSSYLDQVDRGRCITQMMSHVGERESSMIN